MKEKSNTKKILQKYICSLRSFITLQKNNIYQGLTLIELAIVVLVLGIIMAIVYTGINPGAVIDKARILKIRSSAQQLQIQWQIYESSFPRLEDLLPLTVLTEEKSNWNSLRNEDILDPWKRPYFICRDQNNKRHICSYGEDGQPGGENESQDFYLTDDKSWPEWLIQSAN